MKQRTCFVVCPIGDEGSETRLKADLLAEFVLSPVLEHPPFAMKLSRADGLGRPGFITNQIIRELETSDLVVADLSEGNPNVFYEIAIRHVTRKPFIHMIAKGQRIPFDNAPVRAIEFDLTDLRSVDSAKKELATQVTIALEQGQSESPVSIAATLESLRETGNVEKIAMADVLSAVTSLQGSIDRLTANQIALERRMAAPTGMFGSAAASNTRTLGGLLGALSEKSTSPSASDPDTLERRRTEWDEAMKKLMS